MTQTLGLIYSVTKLRIGFAIMFCALAGMAVMPGDFPDGWRVTLLALAVLVASGSAGAFNQIIERHLDRHMARTRNRPFVTGRFRAGAHWYLAIALSLALAVIVAIAATNQVAAAYVFLGAFTYGVIYTVWLKRRTWLNIVIGGLAGSFAVLAGAAAVDPNLSPSAWILAWVLFLWTPPHFWSLAFVYRKEYRDAGVPMLPAVVDGPIAARVIHYHTVALVVLSLLPVLYNMGWIYGLSAAAGGAWFVFTSAKLVANPNIDNARRNFHASLLQLSVLLIGSLVDRMILG